MNFIHIFGILAVGVILVSCQDFGYDGADGPTHWGEQYGTCFGKHQSPININLLQVKRVNLPPLSFANFDKPLKMNVSNNGHTAQVSLMNPEDVVLISGGPLDNIYEFSQFHFHWGDNDTFGSEDRIQGKSFPMELHMVFYKKNYRNARSALEHSDGLTVLAFFFEIQEEDNPAYADITSKLLNEVNAAFTHTTLSRPHSLLSFISSEIERTEISTTNSALEENLNGFSMRDRNAMIYENYFTYNGSLTTPPCSEVVVWLDFEQPLKLSHKQVEAFRSLRSGHGSHLTHNFRPIQPLGDRIVLYNTPSNEIDTPSIDDNFLPIDQIITTTQTPRKLITEKIEHSSINENSLDDNNAAYCIKIPAYVLLTCLTLLIKSVYL